MRAMLTALVLLGASVAVLAQTQPADPQTNPQPAPQTNPQPAPTTAPQTPPPQVVVPPPPPPPQPAPQAASSGSKPQIFYGGGLGLSYGDVRYVELSPLIGWRFSQSFGAGFTLMYRWREDTRLPDSPSYNDYGGTIFARYRLPGPLFLQAEYDYTDYEYQNSLSSTARKSYSSYLAGVGFGGSIGRGAGGYVLALYDFAYDSTDPYRPYTSPWIIRAGVSIGF